MSQSISVEICKVSKLAAGWCVIQIADVEPEGTAVQATDGDADVGYSLINKPFNRTVEDNDTAMKLHYGQ